jgi:cytochrome c-type biogenesis protein CcmH/NrfG
MWVTGLAAYRRGEYPRAVGLWESLLQQLPDDSPIAPQIRHALAQARTQQKN